MTLQGDDDGLLLARDVAALPLAGTELVVLAACDTSCGQPVPGEGILALADALLGAGARTVIASAWVLDDLPGGSAPWVIGPASDDAHGQLTHFVG